MKKENLVIPNFREHTGRMTRARAAAFCALGGMPISKPALQDKKRTLRTISKRAPLDEKNSIPSDTACTKRKRRAVLQDVTNVCGEHSYANCINRTRAQLKNVKQAKRVQTKASKAALIVAAKNSLIQDFPRKTLAQDTIKTEHGQLGPKEFNCSKSVQGNIPSQFSTGSTKRGCATIDCQLKQQNSQVPLQCRSPSKKEKGCVYGKLIISRNPHVKDIDSDHNDPQLCSLYAPEIFNNLRVAEVNRKPCPNFMEKVQRDVTQSMRGILVDWLVEVSEEYKLASDTLYLTVYLIDWFLSQNYIERQRLQLLGITCMLIASKYEEICAPHVEDFCFITDNTYTGGEELKMESQVLNYIGFQILAPTAKTFLRRFIRAAQASYKTPSLVLEYLANYLAELTLTDYGFLKFLPSLIPASAVFLARWTLDQSGHPWNPTLEYYTSYKASDLKTTLFALQDLQLNTNGCPLTAIRSKYRRQKFKSVARLTSSKLLQSLF